MGGRESVKLRYGFMSSVQNGNLTGFGPAAPAPNFISNIFYLTIAMSHYGYLRTVQSYNGLGKHAEDIQRQVDLYTNDRSWVGVRLFSFYPL